MISSPAVVTRLPAIAFSRSYASGCKPSLNRSTRSWTAVATLLTFCPPGPVAARKLSDSASSGTLTSSGRILCPELVEGAPFAESVGKRSGDVDRRLALARDDEPRSMEEHRPAGNAVHAIARDPAPERLAC